MMGTYGSFAECFEMKSKRLSLKSENKRRKKKQDGMERHGSQHWR